MARAMRSIAAIAVLLAAAVASMTVNIPWWKQSTVLIGRFIALALFLVILWLLVFRTSDIRSPAGKLGKPHPVPPYEPPEEMFDVYSGLVTTYEKSVLDLFVNMLMDLPQYLVRINEDAQILSECPQLQLTTRHLYRLGLKRPAAEVSTADDQPDDNEEGYPEVLLVPLVRPQKGTLFDNFVATDGGGKGVNTLSNSQVRSLLVYAFASMLRAIPSMIPDLEHKQVESFNKMQVDLLPKLLMIACAPGPDSRQPPKNRDKVAKAFEAIGHLPVPPEWKERLKRLCEHFRDNYVIVAEVEAPKGDYLRLSYTHRLPDEGLTTRSNRWRARLGMSTHTVDIPLNLYAFQVRAYHFQVNAEPGQYVFDHHLEWLDSDTDVEGGRLESPEFKPYVRLYHNEARANAHLYIRHQAPQPENQNQPAGEPKSGDDPDSATDAPQRIKSVFQFREIPPGALGGVTVVATVSAAIIIFFALSRLGLDIDTSKQGDATKAILNASIPAVLLALPAFTGLLIGAWLDHSRLRGTSVTTYLALAATMAISIASAVYFVYDTNKNSTKVFKLGLDDQHFIRTDLIWLALMASAITLVLFLVRQLASESRYYFQLVSERINKQRNQTHNERVNTNEHSHGTKDVAVGS